MLPVLEQQLKADLEHGRDWCVALSGGLDSTALLHALSVLCRRYPDNVLRAVHVNHGLQADAQAWAGECEQICAALGVPLTILTVQVSDQGGQGPEAAAREARYAALQEQIASGEFLLTAHHRDDQVETLLLRLLRGAGPQGLASISPRRPFGRGWLLRPLLECGRDDIETHARSAGLSWVEDPANEDAQFDRNFLRHRVLPLLRERWPGLGETLPRAARLSGEAAEMLNELAVLDFPSGQRRDVLPIAALLPLSARRQRNLLRFWLLQNGKTVPPEIRLREGQRQWLTAAADRSPVLDWDGGQIRRYRDRLYLLDFDPGSAPDPIRDLQAWDGHGRIELGAPRGALSFTGAGGRALDLPADWEIRFRAGGERIPTAGGRKTVKKLFQERGVVPWMRGHVPLLFLDGKLSAVGDLWQADGLCGQRAADVARVRWEDHPAAF